VTTELVGPEATAKDVTVASMSSMADETNKRRLGVGKDAARGILATRISVTATRGSDRQKVAHWAAERYRAAPVAATAELASGERLLERLSREQGGGSPGYSTGPSREASPIRRSRGRPGSAAARSQEGCQRRLAAPGARRRAEVDQGLSALGREAVAVAERCGPRCRPDREFRRRLGRGDLERDSGLAAGEGALHRVRRAHRALRVAPARVGACVAVGRVVAAADLAALEADAQVQPGSPVAKHSSPPATDSGSSVTWT
jgi:hypothetical protein